MLSGWISVYGFPIDTLPTSGLLRQGATTMRLDAVTQIYAVLSLGSFLRVIKSDVPMVLFDPGFNSDARFVQCWSYHNLKRCCMRQVFSNQYHPWQVKGKC